MMFIMRYFLFAIAFSTYLIGMEDSLPGDLPKDLWIRLFNDASLYTQFQLMQTCKTLQKIYNNKLVYYSGHTVYSATENDAECNQAFFAKIATSKIRDSVTFIGDEEIKLQMFIMKL